MNYYGDTVTLEQKLLSIKEEADGYTLTVSSDLGNHIASMPPALDPNDADLMNKLAARIMTLCKCYRLNPLNTQEVIGEANLVDIASIANVKLVKRP